jgi:PPK2 family polyphosphate:nucleotide phosphotransferase
VPYATVIDGSDPVRLSEHDPADHAGLTEGEAQRRLEPLTDELRELQELLFAAETHGVLVILQGMDAAGKDVTIQNVFATATPEAIRVRHFTEMTDEEEAHGFLWRAHAVAPQHGELVIFDRSYYEQLVRPLVEGEDDEADIDERVEDILAFESILRHAGTVIVKVFLHVSEIEQGRRLTERMEQEPWKISPNDWIARRSWGDYMRAYEMTMQRTATPEAPWLLVPADHQWFHDLVVAEALVERLGEYRDAWTEARDRTGKEKREEAEAEAPDDLP